MKKYLILSTLFCSLLLGVAHAKPADQPLDKMVAIVNDDLITRSELDNGIKAAKMQITQRLDPNVSDKALEQQVLQTLINKKLQLQMASQAGLTISNKDVEDAVARIAGQNNVPVTELYQHVRQAGMTEEEYRTEIHDQILIQKLQQHEVAGRISITPEEVSSFMNSVKSNNNGPKEYRIHDIIVPISDNPKPAELATAQTRALNIKNQIQNGTNCKVVTQTESKKAALQSTDLGWLKTEELPTAFTDAVAKMKKNGVTDPIQTGNGFHVVHLEDVRSLTGANPALTDRRSAEAMLLQQKFEVAVQSWMSKLRSTAFITTTA
jgi:peptidyl-prolyl cis-trans isomerase SurA